MCSQFLWIFFIDGHSVLNYVIFIHSTTLANIFGKSRKDDGTENESLKYTPPKALKPEEPKATQCIFACALLGYEW